MVQILVAARDFLSSKICRLRAHSTFYSVGTGAFYQPKSSWGVRQTTCLHVVATLSIREAILPLPPYLQSRQVYE